MRVLMVTMKLDIGGAETHILELSKALSRRGIEIWVASNGGAYEKELIEAGIHHVKIPFHSKNPSCMIKAYKTLKALIFKERFDVVHAHARIPAFICGLLHKRYHFRFVTTAHWVFTTRFPYNLLTRWGQRSLAVSDDIKKYLIDSYGIKPENIRVTINGIDLDKFSKDTDYSDIKNEFSLEDGKFRIVYVSRMDIDRSYAAHKLIEIVPDIHKEFPNIEVIIVGGGNDLDNIKAEAEFVNQALCKKIIITTGSRTDINKFVASGKIFIGVSRAALEAMACEKPSIIAGNEGYIGIFDQDKLQISIDTNLCCRGCEETTAENLKRDVLTLLNSSEQELERLGKYSRQTVKEHYSVDTMADDAMKMYVSVIKDSLINEVSTEEFKTIDQYLISNPLRLKKKKYDIMLSGYYGFGNSGDDSILYSIIMELKKKKPDIKIIVLSKTPDETSKKYGVDSIHRFNLPSIIKNLLMTDVLISGGGSLIQDVTSNKSLAYYLFIIKLAKMMKKKVMVYANGIGPVINEKNFVRVKNALNKVDIITLREPYSAEELERFGVDAPRIEITADPAFALFPASDNETEKLITSAGLSENSKYCVIALRPWKYLSPDFLVQIASSADYIKSNYGTEVLFINMQPARDTAINESVAKAMKNKSHIITAPLTASQIMGIIDKSEFVIGMRLHTLIYAAKCKTPAIGLVYDPKITSIMDYMGQDYKIPVESPNPLTLKRYIDDVCNNRDAIVSKLEKISEISTEKASKNADYALELLEK